MLFFHPIKINAELSRANPLWVGHFFPLKGMWWRKRRERQALIVSIATSWNQVVGTRSAPGFIEEETFLSAITRHVKDARVVLEHFFEIKRLGFNFGDGRKAATLVVPKKLPSVYRNAVLALENCSVFDPGPEPADSALVQSTVVPRVAQRDTIIATLKRSGRADLIPAVEWLLQQRTLRFYYKPAGKLGARDVSVWPIRSIESWPGWLRTELFGRVIDIENAYCQFLVGCLQQKYRENSQPMELKYPDLLRIDADRARFRGDLAVKWFRVEPTEQVISAIKRLIMSLANGSRISRGLIVSDGQLTQAVRIAREINPGLLPHELLQLGDRLSVLSKQFRAAKRDMCFYLLGVPPTKRNQKKIFQQYLKWERECRYKIWEASKQTGIMMHDGVEGIIDERSNDILLEYIVQRTGIRVSVESPPSELLSTA